MASLIASAAVGVFLLILLGVVYYFALRSVPTMPTLDESPDEKESP